MSRWTSIFLVLLFSCISYGQPPDTSVTIHGKGTRGPYALGFQNIITNSLQIKKDGTGLVSADFTADCSSGLVLLTEPLPLSDSLIARFQYLPLNLKPRYYLHRLGTAEEALRMPETDPPLSLELATPDLSINGSKGFSVQTGAGGGNGLSQSLNLTIRGEIVPGLRTSAHISDKSSGQTAVTRRLEELDKIYLEAESERFKGTFGDFDYIESGGPLRSFQRKLTGLDVVFRSNRSSIKGAAAFFPGEYSSTTISGQDGVLGPYYLTDIGGRQGASILPGSEKVYIDGVLQKRGSQNDYEIDYEAGSLQFAPSKVIRSESRITIDYEIARAEYSRGFYAASSQVNPVNGLTFYSSLVQEGDNKDSPKSFGMTAEVRTILQDAGADRLSAYESGVKHVGLGFGDYELVVDSSIGVAYYRFTGPGRGDYNVSFSFIGINAGSYRVAGAGVYEYVGSRLGDYEPVILIPLPQVKRYGSMATSWISSDSSVEASGELAGSMLDRNTLSDKDDVQKGLAGIGEIGLSRRVFGPEGLIGVKARMRSIGLRTIFPGRVDAVERFRQYDLDPALSSAGEKVEELELTGGPDKQRTIALEIGYLTRPNITRRKRQAGSINWKLLGPISGFSSVERTQGSRTWWKESGGISADFVRTQPCIRVNYERRDGLEGFKYYESIASVPVLYGQGISGQTDLTYRDEKSLNVTWQDRFRSGSIQQKVNFVAGKSGFSGDLAGSYYRKRYKDFSGPDAEQRTGWTRLSYSDPGGKGSLSFNERLSASYERLQAKSYIFVGDGKGEYKYEDGQYIKDAQGDYILVIEELGQGAKVIDISTEFNASFSPLVIVDPSRKIEATAGRLSVETDLAYKLKRSSDVFTGRDLFPWKSSRAENIVFQSGQLSLRAYCALPTNRHRLRYSMARSFQSGVPYVNETTNDNSRSDELSWAYQASKKLDVITDFLVANVRSSINVTEYAVERQKASVTINYRFREQWMLTGSPSYGTARQTDTGLKASMPGVELGLIRDFAGSGRISARIAYTRLNASPRGAYVPYQVAQGKRAGDNIEGVAAARMDITRNGRLDFSYRHEDFSQRPQENSLRLEFTVLFL